MHYFLLGDDTLTIGLLGLWETILNATVIMVHFHLRGDMDTSLLWDAIHFLPTVAFC